ncbi:hypothetical protein [Pseudonocardia nigra]|uniref:hypothetical protein n=1 Tax=Pseudonocardia nigra TaxID=1921578 RepID=UPI001C5E3741|nr:hypothetical protein [Pseudonocardia nigra]
MADAAGVHVSTASGALARARDGRPPGSPVAERVVALAAELRYQPDVFAASLRTRRTCMLGVLVPRRLTDLAVSTIYEGIEETASKLGYQTVVANTLDSPTERRRRTRCCSPTPEPRPVP